MKPWYEDDDFWAAAEAVLFPPDRLAAARTETDGVLKLLSLKPGARILDLCCGPGRHAVEMARRGYKVTGADRNKAYLERARKSAQGLGLEIEFVEEDMRRFVRPGAFDAVTNLFTSFGYFEDKAENLQVLKNIYLSLKSGGSALIDTISREIAKRDFVERTWIEVGDILLLDHRFVSKDWKWMSPRWIIVKNGKRQELRWKIRLYSAAEFRTLLQGMGFQEVRVYGNLDGLPYGRSAKRLVVVAHKGRQHA